MSHFFCVCFIFLVTSSFSADIAIISMVVGAAYKKSVQAGIDNKQLYCRMHGYEFICCEERLDPDRPIPWSKILLIKNIMESGRYSWVFWSDADSLIMNLSTPLEEFLDDNYNLIIGKDKNQINSGQFLMKSCPWSMQLLSDIYLHVECIHHPYWEQEALVLELEQCPSLLQFVKIVPQRIFNSYPPEIAGTFASACYQPGDFVLHFPGIKDLSFLSRLMHKYKDKTVDKPEFSNLDRYLQKAGFHLSPKHSQKNEGYVTEAQKRQFISWLQSHLHIKQIAEIGLNGGHSAEIFFGNCPDLKRFISFDTEMHDYSKVAKEYFMKRYKSRFLFISGDSQLTVPEYAHKSVRPQCDLIYIDGDHSYESSLKDIMNCRLLAHENSILWIDDYNALSVRKAVLECEKNGIITVDEIHTSSDLCGNRSWVVARYVQRP